MPSHTQHAGYRALRRGRWSGIGRIYLLTTVAFQRKKRFAQWQGASAVARAMSDDDSWPGGRLLCWVLMPDHWHGLVELTEDTELARMMQVAKGRAARALNLASGCTGTVWMPGFHERALRREEDIVDAARYVVANPVRAGLVKRVGDYPFWDAIWLDPRVGAEAPPT